MLGLTKDKIEKAMKKPDSVKASEIKFTVNNELGHLSANVYGNHIRRKAN